MKLDNLLAQLLACVCMELEKSGAGEPCFCGLLPGSQVAWDYCAPCEDDHACGMGWVRVEGVFPSEVFPNPGVTRLLTCRAPLVASLEVGALRCLPTMDEDGTPPDEGEQLEAALQTYADMQAIHAAINCCFSESRVSYALGQWVPLGPEGGCVGGQWTLSVELT